MTNKLTYILMKHLGGKEQENNISVNVRKDKGFFAVKYLDYHYGFMSTLL